MSLFRPPRVYILLVYMLFIATAGLIGFQTTQSQWYIEKTQHLAQKYSLDQTIEQSIAKSVIVFDMSKNKIIAAKKRDEVASMASLVKIFTSGLAYKTFLQSHATTSAETRAFLRDIQHMMKISSNEDAERIAFQFGATVPQQLQKMQEYVTPYAITFKNVTGLDVSGGEVGAYGKASDIALAAVRVYKAYPEIFDTTIVADNENTNDAASDIDFFLAGKTGFTDLTGGNLFVVVQKGITHKYAILILGSTENGRFVDVENIAKALLQLSL